MREANQIRLTVASRADQQTRWTMRAGRSEGMIVSRRARRAPEKDKRALTRTCTQPVPSSTAAAAANPFVLLMLLLLAMMLLPVLVEWFDVVHLIQGRVR
jgi:hypothetical protein